MQVSDLPTDKTFEMRMSAQPEAVTKARKATGDFAASHGVSRHGVEVAVAEAVANAVVHGYPGRQSGEVIVRGAVSGTQLSVEVEDDGAGAESASQNPGLGLGLTLIQDATSAYTINPGGRGGTVVRMRFEIA